MSVTQPADGRPHVVRRMVAVEGPERGRVEGLAAEAHAGHAALLRGRHERIRDVERIGLDGDFGPGDRHEPRAEQVEEPPQAVGPEVRRRAAADIQGGEFQARRRRHRREPLQLPRERREVAVDEVIAAGDEREVAVAAAVPAERHVNVDVAGRCVHVLSHYTGSTTPTRPSRHGAVHAPPIKTGGVRLPRALGAGVGGQRRQDAGAPAISADQNGRRQAPPCPGSRRRWPAEAGCRSASHFRR